MSIPLSGEPVRIGLIASSTGTISTASLGLYYPGTSTLRPLGVNEEVTIKSVQVLDFIDGVTGIYIVASPVGTPLAGITSANLLVAMATSSTTNPANLWLDDGTNALTGYRGIVPSVLGTPSTNINWCVTGTGFINQVGMTTSTNPLAFANTFLNANG
jgi:hypothetical protein